MKLLRGIAGAAFLALIAGNASAAVRISNDAGGQIGPYLDSFAMVRN